MVQAVAFAALVVITFTAMALTSGQMAELRVALPLLSRGMSWLEGLDVPFDMDHVAFFSALALLSRLILPRIPWWWIGLGLAALAVGTELMQFAVAGRTPKLQDVRDDLVGATTGLLAGAGLLWSWRLARSAMLARRARRAHAMQVVPQPTPD